MGNLCKATNSSISKPFSVCVSRWENGVCLCSPSHCMMRGTSPAPQSCPSCHKAAQTSSGCVWTNHLVDRRDELGGGGEGSKMSVGGACRRGKQQVCSPATTAKIKMGLSEA